LVSRRADIAKDPSLVLALGAPRNCQSVEEKGPRRAQMRGPIAMCLDLRDQDCDWVDVESNAVSPTDAGFDHEGSTATEWVEHKVPHLRVLLEKVANHGRMELRGIPKEVMR